MKFIKAFLASVALIVAASSANAAPEVKGDFGLITDLTFTELPVTVGSGATFDHIFKFELDSTAADFSVSKLVLTHGPATIWDFSSITFNVFSGEFSSDITDGVLLRVTPIVTADTVEFTLNGLSAGDYFIQVAGDASGIAGGAYTFAITPVPEPSSVAMLLIGFAALGAVARRRKTL
ncbi:FxDxF family PEP-CTERM protein [Methylobacillus sp. Pita1]|uniref:FxDxF family PEP-CTERM protein n=1 Tax=Methylobacillus sp. Pita1 TaxID=3382642 RepID=UPI0038B691DA